MNLKTAAARLSVHYQTAYKLVRSGALAAVKIGGTYEISEAAIERYGAERDAVRAGAATPRNIPFASSVPEGRQHALDDVKAVVASTTTSARAAFDTVARVSAETVGDTAVVVLGTPTGFAPVAAHDVDPQRRAAASTLVHAFGPDGPNSWLGRVRETRRSLLLSHVPQDRLRASVDAQHRQLLDVIGIHSLVIAPIVVDGDVAAAVLMTRATPGAPYGADELTFGEAMAEALRLALARTAAYTAGWRRRSELVERVEQSLRDIRTTGDINQLRNDGFAEVVDDLHGHVLANDATRQLTHGDMSVLLDGYENGTFAEDVDRLHAGDLEYRSDECEVSEPGGGHQRVVVHRGLVRDDAAQPQALVVVAQRVPVTA